MPIIYERGVSFDEDKWAVTLIGRGLDFADAGAILDGPALTIADERFDYGERRFLTFALADARLIVIVWTPRKATRHIISMRKANDREQARFRHQLD